MRELSSFATSCLAGREETEYTYNITKNGHICSDREKPDNNAMTEETNAEERIGRIVKVIDDTAPKSYGFLVGSGVFSFIKNLEKSTFWASNGYQITCEYKAKSLFTGKKLILNAGAPLGFLKIHMARKSTIKADYGEFVSKLSKIKLAMAEALESYKDTAKPEIARDQLFRIVETDNSVCFDITLSENVYDALLKRPSYLELQGITIAVQNDAITGFGNGKKNTLFLNSDFRGRTVRISHELPGYGKLMKRKAEILAFADAFAAWLDVTPIIDGSDGDMYEAQERMGDLFTIDLNGHICPVKYLLTQMIRQ